MKKNVLLLGAAALLLSIGFVACKKEKLADPANPAASTDFQQKDLVNDFGYTLYTLTDNSGATDYKCLKPKTDCTKIKSAASAARKDQEEFLDAAISNGTVSTFFATDSNWNELFPNLKTQQDWLALLTDGKTTLVKKTDAGDGAMLYIAIPTSADPAKFTQSDVEFAIGILDDK